MPMPGFVAVLPPLFESGAWVWAAIAAAIAGGLARSPAQAVFGAGVACCVGVSALTFGSIPEGFHPEWFWRAAPPLMLIAFGVTFAICRSRLRQPRLDLPPPALGTRLLRLVVGVILGGIGGLAVGLPAGFLYVDWARVLSFEGGSGYATIGVALLFGLFGTVLGAIMGWRRG